MDESREKSGRRGAGVAENPTRELLDAYASHHRKIARDSLIRLLRNPIGSLMTWLVMGVALALPLGLMLLLASAQSLGEGWSDSSRINLYLKQDVDETAAMNLQGKLRSRGDVRDVQLVTRKQALAQLRKDSGLSAAFDYLNDNPLPNTLIVAPALQDPGAVQSLSQSLKQLPQVAEVQVDLAWLKRLRAMIGLVVNAVWALGVLLALAVLLVVGNTIRLAIENRRDEIVVAKLVGGTDAFVRRPFLYTGAWYGLGGSIVAIILVALFEAWLDGPVNRLASLYGSHFQLQGAGFGDFLLVIMVGVLLGWMGSWLAVKRHLDAIEPR